MVEYNKYDDLKEQQVISQLFNGVAISEQAQQTNANSQMYEKFIENFQKKETIAKLKISSNLTF